MIFGVIGLFMKLLNFPLAPLILALIVGTEMEQSFRKSLVASDGSLTIFFSSPIACVLSILTIVSLAAPFVMRRVMKEKGNEENLSA